MQQYFGQMVQQYQMQQQQAMQQRAQEQVQMANYREQARNAYLTDSDILTQDEGEI